MQNNSLKQNKYDLFIMITNKCNLNCMFCDHFCPVIEKEWFLSLEEVTQYAYIIKEKMPNLKTILIFGGEPFLHPQLFDICKILLDINPSIGITISTNGTAFNTFDFNEIINKIETIGCQIYMPIYPYKIENYQKYKQQFKSKKQKLGVLETRSAFFQTLIDPTGSQINSYQQCGRVKLPYEFHMYKNKIYACPIASCMEHLNLPSELEDFIDIYKLKNEQELEDLYFKPLQSCKYCIKDNKLSFIPWQKSQKNKNEYFISLKNMFLNEYEKYNQICNKDNYLIESYQNDFFKKYNKDIFDVSTYSIFMNKFFNGIADIYIPYNENLNTIDFLNLKNQIENNELIQKCNLFFFSINASQKLEEYIYNLFTPLSNSKIKSWMFKSKNIKDSFNIFLNNSYNNNIIIFNNTELIVLKREDI